jgi:GT2 family glycosyltransferase
MARPSVDVVLPFAGRDDELEAVLRRLGQLRLRSGDRLLVADNRPRRAPLRTPALDRVEIVAAAARYAHARGFLDARRAGAGGRWAFAQTANCAVRRAAFDALGGFTEGIRAGEDADLCWRLVAAGWGLEPRPEAWAVHIPRQTVRGLIGQMLVHGAAHSWLERAWPGSTPARSRPGLMVYSVRRLGQGLVALARRDADGAITGLLDPVAIAAFEAGRLRRNRARRARR